MATAVVTNNSWRQLCYRAAVPDKVLSSQFDHIEDECDGFLAYKGNWYHVSDFMRFDAPKPEWAEGWDGYEGQSYFSGVVIKIADTCDEYQIGTYMDRG